MNLNGLESRIENQANEARLDHEALARLKKRYPEYFVAEPAVDPALVAMSDAFNAAMGDTMEATIVGIMSSDIARIWTSSELCDRLEDLKFPMNPDRNIRMGQLNEVLAWMMGTKITQVEKGIGRRPGKYRWGV
jgi:hypothetical protein